MARGGSRQTLLAAVILVLFMCTQSLANAETGSNYQNAGPYFASLDIIRSSTPPDVQAAAAMKLISRILPSRAGEFRVAVVAPGSIGPADRDVFILSMDSLDEGPAVLTITASSGYAAAWGFYYYLTQYCSCIFTWGGRQLNVPSPLPRIQSKVKVTSNDRFRYYQNVCTVSYSFVWWNWTRWEQEIDWMAMSGINLPLAFNGQEAIWQRVYLKMGVTQKELDAHFGGPAFLAWARMGNLHGWGGPLPQSWHDQQMALQRQILQRMRELGMTPVLPAFAGHVPGGLARVFPNASISRLGSWGHFNETYGQTFLLDPQDPLFAKVGKAFIEEITSEFGTDHAYNCDTFNEMTPASSDPSYLTAAGSAVFNGMKAGDPNAIWVMQGWLFLNTQFWQPPQAKALLTSVPQGRMIVLDLASETIPQYPRLESYYGQPFIWCMLHNFGGNLPMYGKITTINTGPFDGRKFPNSTMIGTGLTPEGIFQNEMIYEFMNENSWRTSPRNVKQWISDYAKRRYGKENKYADRAWQMLKESVYNNTDAYHDHGKEVIITTRPRKDNLNPYVWYDPNKVFKAWYLLIKASDSVPPSALFRYDLVDVTRQSLQLISIHHYQALMQSYQARNQTALLKAGDQLLGLFSDLDTVLGSDEHFLLGSWLEAAKALGTNDAEKKLYEYNARNQITLWGPDGNIRDYAKKQWSGLVSRFYAKRWFAFIDALNSSIAKKEKFDQETYNNETFTYIEQPFTFDRTPFPSSPSGDPVMISKRLYQKYSSTMASPFFKKLQAFSSKGRKFIKTATRWMKRYNRKQVINMAQRLPVSGLSYESADYTESVLQKL